jgi:hypothetical protein
MYQMDPSHSIPADLQGKFAFSPVFPVLTTEGYQIARGILNREYDHGFVQPDIRIQLCLRGVTYRSPFLRSFSECKEISQLASYLTGEDLVIHGMISNHAHVNWGVPPAPGAEVKNVDQWHKDSVSHVLIVLMSEMDGAVGGELEFIMRPTTTAFDMIKSTNNNVPTQYVQKIKFPGPGWGVLMYGSEIVHHVTPLISHSGPRITLVQSFQQADPWKDTKTLWKTFATGVSSEWSGYEWMHYQSWKLGNQLLSLPHRVAWNEENSAVTQEMRRIAASLLLAADQIERKTTEEDVYFDENAARGKAASSEPQKE